MELTVLYYFIIFSTLALCIFTCLDTLYLILSNMNYEENYRPGVENGEDQDNLDVENDEDQDSDPSAGASIFKSFLRLIVDSWTWITIFIVGSWTWITIFIVGSWTWITIFIVESWTWITIFIVGLWTWITLPVYYFSQKPWKKQDLKNRVWAVPIEVSNEEITYRTIDVKATNLEEEFKEANIETAYQVFDFCVKKYTTKKCLGTREIIKEYNEEKNGKTQIKQELGEYSWLDYLEVNKQVSDIGRGLRVLGLKPRDKIVIYAETCANWLLMALGSFQHSITVVTIYSTLGTEGAVHGISQTDATVVVVSQSMIPSIVAILPHCPNIKHVISISKATEKFEDIYLGDRRVNLLSIDDLIEMAIKNRLGFKMETDQIFENIAEDIPISPPDPEDTAIIMYTSGSSGDPKGVVITHKNICATVYTSLSYLAQRKDDVYIAFLPLAHIFELSFELVALVWSIPIGYSFPNRIIRRAPNTRVAEGSTGDLMALKPTIMCAVPLILERFQKGIQSKIEEQSPLVKVLIEFCFEYKKKWNLNGYGTPIMDRLIFDQFFKKPFGLDNLNLIVCGGACLNAETQEFIRVYLNTQVIQGYGLTETCACGCVNNPHDFFSKGNVGPPTVGVDIKLVNWEEGGYKVTDDQPRGEIIIGGDHVAKEYYNMPEETQEVFFTDKDKRWFKTGDIGHVCDNGCIEIIDRKKDLVKFPTGEYVSLGKVESALKLHPMIENICAVYGDSEDFLVAIVSLNKQNEKQIKSPEEVLKIVKEQAEKQGLKKREIPKYIHITYDDWTPESELVTATQKLKRKNIEKKYQEQIQQLYHK